MNIKIIDSDHPIAITHDHPISHPILHPILFSRDYEAVWASH
nr:MAG TPA: hypothetical protein [Caudoviricetes sp.]